MGERETALTGSWSDHLPEAFEIKLKLAHVYKLQIVSSYAECIHKHSFSGAVHIFSYKLSHSEYEIISNPLQSVFVNMESMQMQFAAQMLKLIFIHFFIIFA